MQTPLTTDSRSIYTKVVNSEVGATVLGRRSQG